MTTGPTIPPVWDFDKALRGNRIVPFQKWHLQVMPPDNLQLGIGAAFEDYQGYIIGMANLGPAFTAMDDNGIGAMFGCAVLWSGLGEMWMIANRQVLSSHPRPVLEVGRRFIDLCFENIWLRRIQVYVMADSKLFCNYARALHMTCETQYPLRKYGPDGRDYHVFARVRDGRNDQRTVWRRSEGAGAPENRHVGADAG